MAKLSTSLKSYVGRVFALRKRAKISGSLSHKDGASSSHSRDDFGEAVFVLDETNAKVRVIKKDGTPLWIPKHYLLKEITSDKEIKLVEVLDTLRVLVTKLQGNLSDDEQIQVRDSMMVVRELLKKKP